MGYPIAGSMFAALTLGLAACNSPAEQAAEQQADALEDQADALRDTADDPAITASPGAAATGPMAPAPTATQTSR